MIDGYSSLGLANMDITRPATIQTAAMYQLSGIRNHRYTATPSVDIIPITGKSGNNGVLKPTSISVNLLLSLIEAMLASENSTKKTIDVAATMTCSGTTNIGISSVAELITAFSPHSVPTLATPKLDMHTNATAM